MYMYANAESGARTGTSTREVLKAYRCLKDGPDAKLPHCDHTKTAEERVDSIVANLSAAEMVAIMNKQPVDRLQIGSYAMWSAEALHGVRLWPERCPFPDRCTTVFPTASTASRAFNTSLWAAVGEAMGTEARVLWNLGILNDLSLRGPQVNIQRDPRWGRNSNSPSEDPLLAGMYGKYLVTGTQKRTDGINLINSQMKHWAAYGVEHDRDGFNANVSVHDLSETYMAPLRMMLEANVSAVMCAYDAINGTPSCANGWMSNTVLRETWGFSGVIESDCGAVGYIQTPHRYASDGQHAASAAMNGTCDVECGKHPSVYKTYLLDAHTAGLVSAEQLAAAARRVLMNRFAVGLFDDPRETSYFSGIYSDPKTVHSDKHVVLARQAAQQGIVVVQNPGNLLPLKKPKSLKSIALIGPMANITDAFLGDYRPAVCPGPAAKAPNGTACLPTLLQLLKDRAPSVKISMTAGCSDGPVCAATSPVTPTVRTAMTDADVIILAIGEKVTDNDSSGDTAREAHDRTSIGLPGRQGELVAAALATKKRVIAVILSGGSVSVDALVNAPNAAVVYAGFGGEMGQAAIIDVLFGDCPISGRLPFTVYPERWGNSTAMEDMSFQAGLGRSYKYLLPSVQPLYEFGAGLSWTSFNMRLPDSTQAPILLSAVTTEVCVHVANTGPSSSPVTVTLFSSFLRGDLSHGAPRLLPNRQLIGFASADVTRGQTAQLCLGIADADVAMVDDAGAHIAYAGNYTLTFFDGKSKVTTQASVKTSRTVALIPPVNNPDPPCCRGDQHSCC